ncbi:hypothetical protein JCM6882_003291 [Rhodosporidiobolus microsporus]
MASVGSHPPHHRRPRSILKRTRSSHAPGLVRLGITAASQGARAETQVGGRTAKRVRWVSPVDGAKGKGEADVAAPQDEGKGKIATVKVKPEPSASKQSSALPPHLAPPLPDMIDGEPFYRVERILGQETRTVWRKGRERREKWYLVKWEGYPLEKATWEPKENLSEAEALDVWIREKRARRRTV